MRDKDIAKERDRCKKELVTVMAVQGKLEDRAGLGSSAQAASGERPPADLRAGDGKRPRPLNTPNSGVLELPTTKPEHIAWRKGPKHWPLGRCSGHKSLCVAMLSL